MVEVFWRIVSAMDAGFLAWMKNEHARHVRTNKPTKKAGPAGRTTSRRTPQP